MKWIEEAIGECIIRYRWWVIAVTLVIAITAGSGARFLNFSNDLRVFFSERNPQYAELKKLENTYSRIDNVLFAVAPKDGNVFTRKTLAAIEELTEASWQMPYSSRVDSITNFQHTYAEEDELIVVDLAMDADTLSDEDLDRIQQIALNEPMLVDLIVSPTGHVTGVNINILLPGKERQTEIPEVAEFARKMADDFRRKYPEINFYLTGGIMLDNAYAEASRDDSITLGPIMFFILFLIMALMLRSFTGTIATMFVILFSVVTGLGLAGWLGIELTTASSGSPVIILTLAVADSVHILASMLQQMRFGKTKNEAIVEAMRINFQPVFLTSITTVIGFLSMNLSDAPPFRDLGNIVAMGIVAAFFYSIFFLPALMTLLPVRVRPKLELGRFSLESLAELVVNSRRQVFIGMLVFIIVLTSGIAKIDLNDDWVKYFSERYEIRTASDFVEDNLRGFHIIEYSLDSGESGGINNPDYLNKLEEFKEWYLDQPNLVHVRTFTNIMKRLNKNMHGDDQAYYRIPDNRQLAAQYLLLYEMSVPFGHDLNNQINVDKSSTRFTVSLEKVTTKEVRAMDDKARTWLKDYAPAHMYTYGSGLSIIWSHLSMRNIRNMLFASFIALVLISVLLIISLKSVKMGLLSLIPNIGPSMMAFGVWGIMVGMVGLGLSVIISLTIGIVVDDTVHFMSKYLRARRELNKSPQDAVRYSFSTVGMAMWVTTITLVAGFLVLTFSAYIMNAHMGIMCALTIALALILDFLFLPAILMKVEE
jgi:predicted RND superfamily exporter protein